MELKRSCLVLAVLFVSFVACSLPANSDASVIVVESASASDYRKFEVVALPSVANAEYFSIRAIKAEKSSSHSFEADVVFFNIDALFNKLATDFAYFEADVNIPSNGSSQAFVSAAGFAFRFQATNIFEYVETNGEAGFQFDNSLTNPLANPANDLIVGYYNLDKAAFNPIQFNTLNFTNDQGESFNVVVASVTSTDGVFKLQVYAAGSPISVNGTKAGPESIKINFEVNYFNNPSFTGPEPNIETCGTLLGYYLCTTSGPSSASQYPNSSIAIVTAFGAVAGTYNSQAGSSPSISFTSGSKTAFFAWEATSEVAVEQGVTAATVYSNVQDNGLSNITASTSILAVAKIISFSVAEARPTTWSWDPSVGYADSSAPPTSAPVPGGSYALVPSVLLVASSVFAALVLYF